MLLDWKSQHCKNDYTAQSNPRIQYNRYHTTKAFFRELEQKNSQFVWKYNRPWLAKAILRKKKELVESGNLVSDYMQSYSNSRQYGTGTKHEI